MLTKDANSLAQGLPPTADVKSVVARYPLRVRITVGAPMVVHASCCDYWQGLWRHVRIS